MALSGGARAARVGEAPGGGDAGLNCVRYRYRLLPHVFAGPGPTRRLAHYVRQQFIPRRYRLAPPVHLIKLTVGDQRYKWVLRLRR